MKEIPKTEQGGRAGEIRLSSGYAHYFRMLYNRVSRMLVFENLPETIDEKFLKICLFLFGKVAFFQSKKGIVSLNCTYSGEPDIYYKPEYIIIANPVIGSERFKVDEDCILMCLTDTDRMFSGTAIFGIFGDIFPSVAQPTGGLFSLIDRTAALLANTDLSIFTTLKYSRLIPFIVAENQSQKIQIEQAISSMMEGDPALTVTADLIDNINVNPLTISGSSYSMLQNIIETHQYILANFWHSIGVNSNANFKRERLNVPEIEVNENALDISIDDIISNVSEAVEKVNKMFNLNINVRLNAEWQRDIEALEEPADEVLEEPADEAPEEPADEVPEESADEGPEESADEVPEESADEEPEEPADEVPEESADEGPEEPADEEPEESADEAPEEPADEATEQTTQENNNNVTIIVNGKGVEEDVISESDRME